MGHLSVSKSCKSNKEVMVSIYHELIKRKLDGELITFLRQYYPIAVRLDPASTSESTKKSIRSDSNKHGVFKFYRPHLLTFPQKMIFIDDDRNKLLSRVKRFVSNKISVDYIIIDDRAYIEYFEPRFEPEVSKVRDVDREIYTYRRKNDIAGNVI